jgi:hypothetical protein
MSRVRADRFVDKQGTGAPTFPNGAIVTGVCTATSFDSSGSITAASGTITGNLDVGGVLTYEDVTNVDSVGLITARQGIDVTGGGIFVTSGVVTATSFSGDGSNLTNVISGVGVNTEGGNVGYGITLLDLRGAGVSTVTAPSLGISTVFITGGGSGGGGGGISTEAVTPTANIVTLDLDTAQDHKVTASGVCEIRPEGGTEAESHTVRIVNSGVSTVTFSSHFLFPSGFAPTLPTADASISLISFTVHREGSTGISTQLLSGASLNYS